MNHDNKGFLLCCRTQTYANLQCLSFALGMLQPCLHYFNCSCDKCESGMDTLKVAKVPWEITNKSPLVYRTVDHISARPNLWQGGGFEEVPVCTISQLPS